MTRRKSIPLVLTLNDRVVFKKENLNGDITETKTGTVVGISSDKDTSIRIVWDGSLVPEVWTQGQAKANITLLSAVPVPDSSASAASSTSSVVLKRKNNNDKNNNANKKIKTVKEKRPSKDDNDQGPSKKSKSNNDGDVDNNIGSVLLPYDEGDDVMLNKF